MAYGYPWGNVASPRDADVMVEGKVWIGVDRVVPEGVRIGDNSTVAEGAVVVKDIMANSLAVCCASQGIEENNDMEKSKILDGSGHEGI